jgi:hypothetical protein
MLARNFGSGITYKPTSNKPETLLLPKITIKKPSSESGEGLEWLLFQHHFIMVDVAFAEHLPYFFETVAGIKINSR